MAPQSLPHPLPDSLVELIAARFRVLAEPMRIRLLDALHDGPAGVADLHDQVGTTQQNVSKHLGVLLDAGIVRRTKEGTRARYAIADPVIFELCDQVCGSLRRQVAELESLLEGASSR